MPRRLDLCQIRPRWLLDDDVAAVASRMLVLMSRGNEDGRQWMLIGDVAPPTVRRRMATHNSVVGVGQRHRKWGRYIHGCDSDLADPIEKELDHDEGSEKLDLT